MERLSALYPRQIDLSLTRMGRLLEALGSPHTHLPTVIHVAGTNGKGSVIAFLHAFLEQAGLRVHVYTSPHLVRFEERIRLAGSVIDERELMALLEECEQVNKGEPITVFEVITAAALLACSRVPADVMLLETGLGGRLDATNVVARPLASIITPISLDHRDFLGDTIAAIAAEKAGIIKTGVPVIVGCQMEEALAVLRAHAADKAAPIYEQGQDFTAWSEGGGMVYQDTHGLLDLSLPALSGIHQIDNAGAAIATLRFGGLSVADSAIEKGVRSVEWPGRLQALTANNLSLAIPIRPDAEIWLDGGHNPGAALVLSYAMKSMAQARPLPLYLITGMMANKDAATFFSVFGDIAHGVQTVALPDGSGWSAENLADMARGVGLEAYPAANVQAALDAIFQNEKNPCRILICGSLKLAGHILKMSKEGEA
ncbi:MAG: folylpolyglutamate synthase/dihydrofolate synthase family protein [Parvularculales bacterium]